MTGASSPPVVELLVVTHHPHWGKWPDTADKDYSSVVDLREETVYEVKGAPVIVRTRYYPIYRPYAETGCPLATAYPFVCNTALPDRRVMDAIVRDLEAYSRVGCRLLLWEHARSCFEPVARHLPRLFRHSIIWHADDCPGTTDVRIAPVARFFNSAMVGNVIWCPSGELTADMYHRLGVPDVHYMALGCTGGFVPQLEAVGFDLERRIRQLRERRYAFDLVAVGGLIGNYRASLNLPSTTAAFRAAGLRTKIYGLSMRDGPLLPRDPADLGAAVAGLYLNAFATLNLQFIGLIATRAFDAWRSGTLLIQHDPVYELSPLEVFPGLHYADYDWTIPGLIRTVRYYQEHLDETEEILRAGHAIGEALPREHNYPKAMARILTRYGDRLF